MAGAIAAKLRVNNIYARLGLAEFLGTFILIVFGDGSVAQAVLSKNSNGSPLSIHWNWCMAVIVAAYVSTGVSGAHLNPAISVAMSLLGRLPLRQLPVYLCAQYLGAFSGAAVVFLVYYDALNAYDGGIRVTDTANSNATAGIFSTYPQPFLTVYGGMVDQIVGTALLVISILAFTDDRNSRVPKYSVPVLAGISVYAIGTAYGFNCGYAVNPARDLGPRIFTSIAGWGAAVFSFHDYWFWVPVVGPHIGAVVGALIYVLLIQLHWPQIDYERGLMDGVPDELVSGNNLRLGSRQHSILN